MKTFFNNLYKQTESKIRSVSAKEDDVVLMAEEVMKVIQSAYQKLKIYIYNYKFKDLNEEIYFFKELKPKLTCKLILYKEIRDLEVKKPETDVEAYLQIRLEKIKEFQEQHSEFYHYYRSHSTYLDHLYFVRGKVDVGLNPDNQYFEKDGLFTTSHDFYVAQLLANRLLIYYITNYSDNQNKRKKKLPLNLTWKDSKTNLVELIYALHTSSCLGDCSVSKLAQFFEDYFNVDLGDYYHTYIEICARKTHRTKFLETLQQNLANRIIETDK